MPTVNTEPLPIALESQAISCDAVRVRRFAGREAISRLFAYDVEVVVDDGGPSAEDFLGVAVSIVLDRVGGSAVVRRLHGMVVGAIDALERLDGRRCYSLRIAPRAYALSMVETSETFVHTTVPSLVAQKLEATALHGESDFRLLGDYPLREFIVQYQETDLAFVSRLTEHLGVSFFFEHDDSVARLVFADDAQSFGRVQGEVAHYRARGEALGIFELRAERTLVPGFHSVCDYNYRTPLVDLTSQHSIEDGFAGGRIEFGSHHKTPAEGAAIARARAEECRAAELVYVGRSTVPTLAAGHRVRVEGHPELGSVELLVTEVEHAATQVVAGFDAAGTGYENTFKAILATRTYRPPRVTPKPRISGVVTGLVDAGPGTPEGRYANLDAEGRYLVRFFFDTTCPTERATSRPVRMLQNHAGEGYGTHFPLKPGTEVAVAFVGGDPDRPIIVGAIPNALTPSPVNAANPGVHRMRTSRGVTIDLVE
ncbi:MAG: type VI secretion system tip protein VgrG [Deltaproteobacteria bacterium]|nr:type VI secretion system tip protein VgrG [Deltaproteobacteria bacterium]